MEIVWNIFGIIFNIVAILSAVAVAIVIIITLWSKIDYYQYKKSVELYRKEQFIKTSQYKLTPFYIKRIIEKENIKWLKDIGKSELDILYDSFRNDFPNIFYRCVSIKKETKEDGSIVLTGTIYIGVKENDNI